LRIQNNTGLEKITQAIFHFYITMPEIIQALKKLPPERRDFTYTDKKNWQIVMEIESAFYSDMEISIEPWWPFNIWTSAIATTFSNDHSKAFINMRKVGQFSYRDYAGVIGHEVSHLVGFGHGNNYVNAEKMYSVPWSLGRLVSGASSWPLVKDNPRIEIPSDINMICERSWRTLWLRRCRPLGASNG
jgi:hypothetical protein